MKVGKISEPVLKRSVLKKIAYKDKTVISRAAVGHDSAVMKNINGDKLLVTATETVVAKRDYHHNRAFIKAVNNVAAVGGTPAYAQISIVLPEGMREIKLKMLMDEMSELAAKLKIHITGGHTAVSDAVLKPVVTVTVMGYADEEKAVCRYKESVKAGFDIVMTKAAGLEGTALLAEEYEEEFLKRFTPLYVNSAKKFIEHISVMEEAEIARDYGVAAMHDMSEGGVFGALWELGEAMNHGLKVDLKRINIRQETIELTNHLNINPYLMPSSGSLLMVTSDGLGLVSRLEENGIDAYIIGKVTEDNDKVIINEDEKRFLEPPK
jgi:hydrogenase maturation factor